MINVVFQMSLAAQAEIIAGRGANGEPSAAEAWFEAMGARWVGNLPECRQTPGGRVAYQAIVPDSSTAWIIEQSIRDLDQITSPIIVGAWHCATGLQHGYSYGPPDEAGVTPIIYTAPEPDEVRYPFDITAYADMLADIPIMDADGNVTGYRRPTEAEARNRHINTIAGRPDKRDLGDYTGE